MTLSRRLAAEGIGSVLLAMVVGSAIMAGRLAWNAAGAHVLAHLAGALAGVAAAHAMFSEPAFSAAVHTRTGAQQWWSEFLASSA